VLCLNLPAETTTAAGRALASWSEVGQPVYLTARQLLRDPPLFPSLRGRRVYVCENPTVVAEAANVLGSASAPLVCASGHPAGAATVLLRLLAASGAHLLYHGDFDWPGITIANGLFARFGVAPGASTPPPIAPSPAPVAQNYAVAPSRLPGTPT
jgi:uncharacterized protein (TIGR02679 family)